MVSLTNVPATLPEDKVPTKQNVKDIIAAFLPREWSSQDVETLAVTYSTSFTNPSCVVERPLPVNVFTEPLKLFIKFHRAADSGIPAFSHLVPTKQEEALLTHEYARSGLGAKVYGLFQTVDGTIGRVDEFLDARNLEPEDVEQEGLREELARGLATFHSLEMALPLKPIQAYYEAVGGGLQRYYKSEKLKAIAREGAVPIDDLIDYDIASRLKTILAKLQSVNAKTGWCIHDIQSMNILVKNNPTVTGRKITLIDFEFVFQNYRAFDIGGHFMQKLFKWFDKESRIAPCRPYLDEEKRHFCDAYAAQWNAQTGNSDTGAQVYEEAELGYMLATAFDLHNMMWYMDMTENKDPLDLKGLNKLSEEFRGQYKNLGLEEHQ
ncbi:choline/ethanolamine kinase [Stachybotrys elegans]|uniref:Choline/ethanolamine kinase n=1 Tax=Stachybotrys elegans TaxID=80388 RepID=A0A8K0SH58_9HYPO|nr:choline/ethanolamine kinase [Stachybotrys elegans]